MLLAATAAISIALTPSALPVSDRLRIAQAEDIARRTGDRVWPGWSKAAFVVDLITPQNELLIGDPSPGKSFSPLGRDELLDADVYYRQPKFTPQLEATFPLVDVPTIVIGSAEDTKLSSTRWVVTLLHEHFHQWQDIQPNYYAKVTSLGLTHGDTTGMWMLNYAFPYTRPDVMTALDRMRSALSTAVLDRGKPSFRPSLKRYLGLRAAFRARLSPDDYKYFAFQCWMEGVARYTEIRIAQQAATTSPLPDFAKLPDASSFAADAEENYTRTLRELRLDIAKNKRVAFYAVGASEALLLDAVRPGWKARYFTEPFDLGIYF